MFATDRLAIFPGHFPLCLALVTGIGSTPMTLEGLIRINARAWSQRGVSGEYEFFISK